MPGSGAARQGRPSGGGRGSRETSRRNLASLLHDIDRPRADPDEVDAQGAAEGLDGGAAAHEADEAEVEVEAEADDCSDGGGDGAAVDGPEDEEDDPMPDLVPPDSEDGGSNDENDAPPRRRPAPPPQQLGHPPPVLRQPGRRARRGDLSSDSSPISPLASPKKSKVVVWARAECKGIVLGCTPLQDGDAWIQLLDDLHMLDREVFLQAYGDYTTPGTPAFERAQQKMLRAMRKLLKRKAIPYDEDRLKRELGMIQRMMLAGRDEGLVERTRIGSGANAALSGRFAVSGVPNAPAREADPTRTTKSERDRAMFEGLLSTVHAQTSGIGLTVASQPTPADACTASHALGGVPPRVPSASDLELPPRGGTVQKGDGATRTRAPTHYAHARAKSVAAEHLFFRMLCNALIVGGSRPIGSTIRPEVRDPIPARRALPRRPAPPIMRPGYAYARTAGARRQQRRAGRRPRRRVPLRGRRGRERPSYVPLRRRSGIHH